MISQIPFFIDFFYQLFHLHFCIWVEKKRNQNWCKAVSSLGYFLYYSTWDLCLRLFLDVKENYFVSWWTPIDNKMWFTGNHCVLTWSKIDYVISGVLYWKTLGMETNILKNALYWIGCKANGFVLNWVLMLHWVLHRIETALVCICLCILCA